MMTKFVVVVEDSTESLAYEFDGEPQINLTFEVDGSVYKVTSRAHDEHADKPTIHAVRI